MQIVTKINFFESVFLWGSGWGSGVKNWNFPPCREDNYCFLHQMRARDDGRSIRLLGIPRPGGEVEDRSSCFFSCKRFFNIESFSPARVSRASTPRRRCTKSKSDENNWHVINGGSWAGRHLLQRSRRIRPWTAVEDMEPHGTQDSGTRGDRKLFFPLLYLYLLSLMSKTTMRVLSWNIWFSPYERDARMRYLEWKIQELNPDVISLQVDFHLFQYF